MISYESLELPDPPLSPEQAAKVALLSAEQLAAMDAALVSCCIHRWRKVARVVGSAMGSRADLPHGIPDVFYSQRVRYLVESGLLESAGNLAYMRYSEVRLRSDQSVD